jgi:DNA-binding transcriptional MerR regulator
MSSLCPTYVKALTAVCPTFTMDRVKRRAKGGNRDDPAMAVAAAAVSIRVASNRTGLSPDTLRVWERRYGFPRPDRREDGVRVYSEDDIVRLELVARAIEGGWRPNEVVALPLNELRRITSSTSSRPTTTTMTTTTTNDARDALDLGSAASRIDAVIDALARDDLAFVRSHIRAAAVMLGPKAFVTELAHPLIVRVGEQWAEGKLDVRHEHVLTSVLTVQLHLFLGAHEDAAASPTVLLATLPGEAHALALDMVAVYLAAAHAAPRVLGPNTPPEQIVLAARGLGTRAVGVSTSIVTDKAAMARALRVIARGLRATRCELWVGGAGAADLELPSTAIRIGSSWSDVDQALASIRG